MTTREQKLRELCMRWRIDSRSFTPTVASHLNVCADELAAILNEEVEVSDAMVERYVTAVNEHLGSLTAKDWEIERFDPVASIARVARIGLTAALKEAGK